MAMGPTRTVPGVLAALALAFEADRTITALAWGAVGALLHTRLPALAGACAVLTLGWMWAERSRLLMRLQRRTRAATLVVFGGLWGVAFSSALLLAVMSSGAASLVLHLSPRLQPAAAALPAVAGAGSAARLTASGPQP